MGATHAPTITFKGRKMKIRSKYVSNSSSSSFICNVCGNLEYGFDIGLSEVGMVTCGRGHVLCTGHAQDGRYDASAIHSEIKRVIESGYTDFAEYLDAAWPSWDADLTAAPPNASIDEVFPEFLDTDEFWENLYIDGVVDTIPTVCCPICSMNYIEKADLLNYAMQKLHTTREELTNEIKGKYSNYEQFMQDLYKK